MVKGTVPLGVAGVSLSFIRKWQFVSILLVFLLFFSSFAFADLVFNSRTGSVDFNTNGTLRSTILVDGNFGVGTATPKNLFNVFGDANVTGTLYAGTVTSPGIPTDATIDANVEAILALRVPWADANVANDITLKSSKDANFWNYLSTSRIYSVDNNSLSFYTNGSERVRFTSDGNVGIGDTSPDAKLDIAGITVGVPGIELVSDPADGTAHAQIVAGYAVSDRAFRVINVRSGGSRHTFLTFNLDYNGTNYTQGSWGGSSSMEMRGGAGEIYFYSDPNIGAGSNTIITPSLKMVIASTGIGIGGDTNPDYNLEVGGTFAVSSTAAANADRFIVASDGNVGIGDTTPQGLLDVSGGKLLVTSDGNVGVGTTSPSVPLEVVSALNGIGLQIRGASANAGYLELGFRGTTSEASANYAGIRAYRTNLPSAGSTEMQFFTNLGATDVMRLTSDGNVGVGTVYPPEKFTVMRGNILLDANSVEKANMIYYRDSTYYGSADTRNGGKISVIGGSAGRLLNRNPDFIAGSSAGYTVYDNSAGGKTTISVVSDENAPNSSGYKLRIAYDGNGTPDSNPSPGYGGFYPPNYGLCTGTNQSVNAYCYRPGQRIMERIWAQIPVGYILEDSSNGTGTSRTQRWLTPTAGTGKWEEYIYMQTIGVGGSLSTTGHKMISSGTNQAFDWNVALYEVVALDESPGYDRASSLNVGFSPTPVLDFGQFSTRNDAFLAMGASTEYVGVGIGSPAVKLDINSASNTASLRIRGLDAANEIADFYVGSSGQLQITTSNTGDSASYIEIDPEDDQFGLILRDSSTGSSDYANLYTTSATVDYLNIVINAANTTAGLVIDDEDQVGVGTVIPNNKLNVIGDLNVITSATKNYPSLHVSGTDGNTGIRRTAAAGFALDVNGDARVSRDFNAFGITTTDLNVLGTLSSGSLNPVTITTSGAAIFRGDANFYGGVNTNALRSFDNNNLSIQTKNTARITVLTDGNVGINTTTPDAKLDIESANDTAVSASALQTLSVDGMSFLNTSTTANAGSAILFRTRSSNTALAAITGGSSAADASELLFFTESANSVGERMRIASDGNVGIGTTNPQAKLNVVGDSNFANRFVFKNSSQQAIFNVDGNNHGNVSGFGRFIVGGGGEVNQVWGGDNTGTYTSMTTATTKIARIGFAHAFTNEVPVNFAVSSSGTTGNSIQFGGGTSLMNQVQAMYFYTGPDLNAGSTDENNTIKIYLNSTRVGLGSRFTSPLATVHVSDINGAEATAFRVDGNSLNSTATAFVVTKDGNVGIGDTTPTATLTVAGGIEAGAPSGTVDYNFTILGGSSGNGSAKVAIGSTATRRWELKTNASPYMFHLDYVTDTVSLSNVITAETTTGHVGIGGDTTPDYNLEVGGTFAVSSTASANADRLVVASDGNVGLGIATPAFPLDVERSTTVTAGKFGNTLPTYIINNNPTVGLNAYYDNGWKYGKGSTAHYGSVMSFIPSTGQFTIGISTTAGSAGDAVASMSTKFAISQDGNVGIGDSAPDNSFQVGTTPTFAVNNTQGRVGIGLLRPANLFNVLGDGNVTGTLYVGAISGGNIPTDSTIDSNVEAILALRVPWADANVANDITIKSSQDANFWNYLSTNRIYSVDNNSLALYTNGSQRVTVATDGNVGIGVAAPAKLLEIQSTTTQPALRISNGGGATPNSRIELYRSDADAGMISHSFGGGSSGGLVLRSTRSDGSIIFQTASTLTDAGTNERMRIGPDGNVGIGTTTPKAKLEIVENNESTTQTDLTQDLNKAGIIINTEYTANAYTPGIFWKTSNNNSDNPKAGIYMQETGNGTYILMGTSNDYATGITNNALVINYDGNVGINDSAPGARLSFGTPTTTGVNNANMIRLYDSTTNSYGWGLVTSTGEFAQTAGTSGFLTYQTANTERMRIASDGNVGIGDSTPNNTFQVGTDAVLVVNDAQNRVGIGVQTPTSTFNVSGDINISTSQGDLLIGQSGGVGPSIWTSTGSLHLGNQDSAAALNIYDGVGTKDIALDLINGIVQFGGSTGSVNVGIATITPNNKLNVIGDLNIASSATKPYPSLFVASADGNTGIRRTAASGYALDVNGDARVSGTLSVNGSQLTGSQWTTSGSNIYFPSAVGPTGFVGVGVTSPAVRLDVNGQARFGDSSTGSTAPQIVINVNGGNGTDSLLRAYSWSNYFSEFGYDYDGNNATIINSVTAGARGAVKFLANGANTVTIASDGNVGIGTTAPKSVLEVRGDLNIVYNNDQTDPPFLLQRGVTGQVWAIHENNNDFTIKDWTNNADRFVITDGTDGNVGIGTTAPSKKLVVQTGTTTDGIYLTDGSGLSRAALQNNASIGGNLLLFNAAGTAQSVQLSSRANADQYFNSGGNFGIGDTTPDANLEVAGAFMISSTAAGDGDRLIVRTDGNVGINTTTPKAKLNVVGDFNVWSSTTGKNSLVVSTTDSNVGIGLVTVRPQAVLQLQHSTDNTVVGGSPVLLISGNDGGSGSSRKMDIAFKTWTGSTITHAVMGVITTSLTGNELGELYFATNTGSGVPVERVRIASDGNIGIGITTPKNKLNVIGDFNVAKTGGTGAPSLFVRASDGNVGIGADPVYSMKLTVNGSATIGGESFSWTTKGNSLKVSGDIEGRDDLYLGDSSGYPMITFTDPNPATATISWNGDGGDSPGITIDVTGANEGGRVITMAGEDVNFTDMNLAIGGTNASQAVLLGNTKRFAIEMKRPTISGSAVAGGGLTTGQSVYWVVTAIDGNGGETYKSNQDLMTSGSGYNSRLLTWPAVPGAVAYKVYRSILAGNFVTPSLLTTTSATSYLDTNASNPSAGAPPNFTKAYAVKIDGSDGYTWFNGGNVGINSARPSTLLDINGYDNNTAMTVRINAAQASVTTLDTFIDFRSTTGSEGSIAGTGSAGVLAYNTFTGSHYTKIVDRNGLETYSCLESTGEKIQPGDWNDGAAPKGQLVRSRICSTAKSKAAWGVYVGTDNLGRDMVASLGTGFAMVANKGIDIEIGDYLNSSAVKGKLERQDDDILRSYTVAKALEPIDWNAGETSRVIAVTYHSG